MRMASRSVIVSLGHLTQGLHDRILQIIGMPSKPPTTDLGVCNFKVQQLVSPALMLDSE